MKIDGGVSLRLHQLHCGNRSRQGRDMPLHGLPDPIGFRLSDKCSHSKGRV
jgi:hypothetical protein